MKELENLLSLIITKKCAHSLASFNFADTPCIKLFISKGLSIGIVLGAMMVKVPQILAILSSSSTKGLALSAILLEQIAITISLLYNYRQLNPFSTYGEGAFIAIQNMLIIYLMFKYKNNFVSFVGLFIAQLVLVYFLSTTNMNLLSNLQLSTILIGMVSKMPQIYSNFSTKSTGTLSFTTTLLQFLGTVARVFTTMQEVDDLAVLATFLTSCFLNGVILIQIITYPKMSSKSKGKQKTQ